MPSEAKSVLAKERFIGGLCDAELKKHVKLARCANFMEAVNCATQIESLLFEESCAPAQRNAERHVRMVNPEASASSLTSLDDWTADRPSTRRTDNGRLTYPRSPRGQRANGSSGQHNARVSFRRADDPTDAVERSIENENKFDGLAAALDKLTREIIDLRASGSDNSRKRRALSTSPERRAKACFICGDLSHFARRCPQREENQKN
jgi:hypothetical protein